MLRTLLAFAFGALRPSSTYFPQYLRLPVYMTCSRQRFTGIAKARREKRRRRARK